MSEGENRDEVPGGGSGVQDETVEEDILPLEIDFAKTIASIREQSDERRTSADNHLKRGTWVAGIAIAALLLVVVGGELVVRRSLNVLVPSPEARAAQEDAYEAKRAADSYNQKKDELTAAEVNRRKIETDANQWETINESLRSARKQSSELDTDFERVKPDIGVEESKLSTINERIDRYEAQIAALTSELSNLQKSDGSATERLEVTKRETSAAEVNRNLIIQRVENTKKKIADLTNRLQANDAIVADLKTNERDLSAERDVARLEANSELDRLKRATAAVEMLQKSTTEKKVPEKELRAAEDELSARRSGFVALDNAYQRKVSELDSVRSQIQELGERTKQLLQDKQAAETQLATLLSSLDQATKELNDTRSRLSEAESESDSARASRIRLENRLAETRNALTQARDDQANIKALLSGLYAKRENIETAQARTTREINGLLAQQRSTPAPDQAVYLTAIDRINSIKTTVEELKAAKERAAARAEKSLEQSRRADSEDELQTLLTRGGAIAGAVGILILLVQVSINSTRYHARLADLYASQANALEVSNGNLRAAEVLLAGLSPLAVDFGKTPTTIYEKALDAVREIGRSQARSGR